MHRDEIEKHNGSLIRTEEHTHAVSLWHIPGGCEYHLARLVIVFFLNETDANNFARPNLMPPEIADVTDLTRPAYNNLYKMSDYCENGRLSAANQNF